MKIVFMSSNLDFARCHPGSFVGPELAHGRCSLGNAATTKVGPYSP